MVAVSGGCFGGGTDHWLCNLRQATLSHKFFNRKKMRHRLALSFLTSCTAPLLYFSTCPCEVLQTGFQLYDLMAK